MAFFIIVGFLLIVVAAIVASAFDPRIFGLMLLVIGFLFFVGAVFYGAAYCPWVWETGLSSPTTLGFGAALVLVSVIGYVLWKRANIGSLYSPTRASMKSLQKELDLLTRLGDQRAMICSMVPDNARDHQTGRPATLEQLCDYRWCARWLYEEDLRQRNLGNPPNLRP